MLGTVPRKPSAAEQQRSLGRGYGQSEPAAARRDMSQRDLPGEEPRDRRGRGTRIRGNARPIHATLYHDREHVSYLEVPIAH